ncbi:hypothetical protein WDV76_04400 [Xenorhabdus griffiniae]|uniref:hypothetical protein n=1 Tax=Xenorhabdus griffiniae TaxID=351672 RepID=UPI0030D59D54
MSKLQPLRIPSGWSIDINNFYEFEPTEENIEWYFGSVLIGGCQKSTGLSFDSRYEPEGKPFGDFILVYQKIEFDKRGRVKNVTVLKVKKTKDKSEFINMLEHFMITEDFN